MHKALHMPLGDSLDCNVPIRPAGLGGVSRSERAAAVALCAGQRIDAMDEVIPAADRLRQILEDARVRIDRLADPMTSQGGP